MGNLKTIFETCKPRPDVEAGTTRDEQFAADLAQVIRGTAPLEYRDPGTFFRHTYPTRGLKELLKAVCKRVSGAGGEVASIIRLHTQYGGGKTHGLIALVHAVHGMEGVPNVKEFIDPDLLPAGAIRVAALDGENSDPGNGLTLEGNLRAYTLWGELAYQLAGVKGYERVKKSDQSHTAPGAETIRELFGGEPTLILLDEVAVYLRKAEHAHPGASKQFTPFIQALFKAVESSPQAALVYTLAVGKHDEAKDAYKEEHERALESLNEAEKVAARKATQLNPTEEDETADVLRRRLFETVDRSAANAVISAYSDVWGNNKHVMPDDVFTPETKEQFRRAYPLHPETLEVLTEKTSSLSTFQRIRGMVRLLAKTVHVLWKDRPADVYAIHPHHIDLSFGPIRDEIIVRLEQDAYNPALKADVAALPGDEPARAEFLDQKHYPGQIPVTSYIARTVFLNTLAFGDSAKGINLERLNFSVCSPKVEPSFIEQARVRFIEEALHLDDRPGAPMRFMVEPNLNQVIRKQMEDVDSEDLRNELRERIRKLFSGGKSPFNLVAFPSGPYEVPDEVGDGRPLLVVHWYEAFRISAEPKGLPPEIEEIYRYKGANQDFRDFRNNLVFVVADERKIENMKDKMRRHLALHALLKPDRIRELVDHQQRKVKEESENSSFQIAESILHCYRHLFYPSHIPMAGCEDQVGYTVIEVTQASDSPGDGQRHVERILREQKKLLGENDKPDAPTYVRDQTPLKTKGEISTATLRNEFRRAPKLSILLSDTPLKECIREGIEHEVFIYREGNQVWGKGDPSPSIRISDDAFVHTVADAKKKRLWPRAEPLEVDLSVSPRQIKLGEKAVLAVSVTGGVSPYTYSSNESALCLSNTSQAVVKAEVSPTESTTYTVEVSDSHGQKQTAKVDVLVARDGKPPEPPKPPKPPQKPVEFTTEGPLNQALTELWEKVRKADVKSIQKLIVKFYEASAASKVHLAVATLQDVEISCCYEVSIEAEGITRLEIKYEGNVPKANPVRSFLDQQIRSSKDCDFEADYTMVFPEGLSLAKGVPEAFQQDLTHYGSGEAYVEAYASPPKGA
ncbi:MAG TPA: DUF499 domain-containing protein [bacterium]|nr:DUF499 domain-containing protein [bacterium]HQL64177.1 DUF499 domain-containing protein [bacterium]